MVDDHVTVSRIGDDPSALAKGIALHPGMYMGGPETFERAVAYLRGVEMAVIAADAESPLTDEDRALLMERPEDDRTPQQEREDIRRLEPLLGRLFATLPRKDA